MSYLWVVKASLVTSKYDAKVSKFKEVYLVTWYEGRYIVKFVIARLSCQKSKVCWHN